MVHPKSQNGIAVSVVDALCGGNNIGGADNRSTPKSFYTNGGLKLRVVIWTISSLMAILERDITFYNKSF